MTTIRFLSEQILTVFGSDLEDSDIYTEVFHKDEVIESLVIDFTDEFISLEFDSGCIIPNIPLSNIEILNV